MDFADIVNDTMEQYDKQIHSYRFNIKEFVGGDCEECGTYTKRLVGILCCKCIEELRAVRRRK